MSWWKTFSAVFVMTLVAGLGLFVWGRINRGLDMAAADWNEAATAQVKYLSLTGERFDRGEPVALGPDTDHLSLRGSLKYAEELLAQAPPHAQTADLKRAVWYAKDALAERH